jgi:origin recognition complex subunit 5
LRAFFDSIKTCTKEERRLFIFLTLFFFFFFFVFILFKSALMPRCIGVERFSKKAQTSALVQVSCNEIVTRTLCIRYMNLFKRFIISKLYETLNVTQQLKIQNLHSVHKRADSFTKRDELIARSRKDRNKMLRSMSEICEEKKRIYQKLCKRWPARKKQIDELLAALSHGMSTNDDYAPNVHIHGPPCAAKTMLTKDVFKSFGIAHAYVSCVDQHTQRLMFECVLESLQQYEKVRAREKALRKTLRAQALASADDGADDEDDKAKENENDLVNDGNDDDDDGNESNVVVAVEKSTEAATGFTSTRALALANNGKKYNNSKKKRKRAIHVADFVQLLKETLARNAPRITIIVDDAHRLMEQKDDRFLPTLLKIGELTKRNIHVVCISRESFQTFHSEVDLARPKLIFFDAYTKDELIEVLLKEAPRDIAQKHYRAFLKPMVAAFYDTCRAPRELRTALEPLWKRYSEKLYEAIRNGTAENELPEPRRLYANLMSAKKLSIVRASGTNDTTTTATTISTQTAVKTTTTTTMNEIVQSPRQSPRKHQPSSSAQKKKDEEQSRERLAANTTTAAAATTLSTNHTTTQGAKIHAGLTVPLSKANLALQRGEWPVPEERYFTGEAVLEEAHATTVGGAKSIAKALDFDIPKLTKFLLIAAYIASKNDESVDGRLFDSENSRRSKKRGRNAHDKNVERAAQRSLEDTNAFKLERLLSVFQHIVRRSYEENGSDIADLEEELLSADVFTQISSATSLGLLQLAQGDAMCGGKYRSAVSDELAEKLSRNLNLALSDYIHYV